MRRFNKVSATVLVGAALAFVPAHGQDYTVPEDAPQAVPGEYLITLEPGVSASEIDAALEGPGPLAADNVEVLEPLPLVNAILVRLEEDAPGLQDIDALEELRNLPGVANTQPNYLYWAVETPDDPRFGDQYMFNVINAEQAWDTLRSAEDVVVAIVDTGIDYNHPDLTGNMWTNPAEIPNNNVDDDNNGFVDDVHGVNVVDPASPSGDPMDGNRHGTHVAGIVAAFTDNSLDIAGVAWRGQLMAVKFLSDQGSGTTAGAISAINYAINNGADLMNNSWGGGPVDPLLRQAIQAAADQDILFLAAAGNAGNDNDASAFYPCNYDIENVLCVMATNNESNPNDITPSWTNFGATTVDIAGPGVDILSTVLNGQLQELSGTSMATPVVSGAAALLYAQDTGRDHNAVKQIIMQTAEALTPLSGRNVTGGRLDLAAALGGANGACTRGSQLAYNEFYWHESQSFSSNTNVMSVDFTLSETTAVLIHVQGSADRSGGTGPKVFRTGVYNGASPNVMWTGSYRRGTLAATNQPDIVASQFAINLPAGDHTMYWKLWLSGFTMEFDSASMSVVAIPCDMGGKLAGAAVLDAAPVTQAGPAQ